MAKIWAGSLRRIELSGLWMRADRFELFIRYFRNLQVCRISILEPFHPESQTFDKDEEPVYILAQKFRRASRIPVGTQYMGSDAVSLLRHHQTTAAWPPYHGKRPYTLPSLHTLHLDNIPDLLSHFRFPSAYDLLCRTDQYTLLASKPASSAFSPLLEHFACGTRSSCPIRIYSMHFRI